MRRLRSRTAAVMGLGFLACNNGDWSHEVPQAAWDSAGIHIVQNGPLNNGVAFTFAEQPDYIVGWRAGDYLFREVIEGWILSDGSVAILDQGNQEIPIVSIDGGLLGVLGGVGEGPGQFKQLWSSTILGTDTIVAHQGMRSEFTLFHDGQYVGTISVPDLAQDRLYSLIGADRTGRVLLRPVSWTPIFESEWLRDTVIAVDLSTRHPDTALVYDFRASASYDPGNFHQPFGVVGMAGGYVVVARSDRPEIRVVDTAGHVRRIIRWQETRPVATAEFWSAYETQHVEMWSRYLSEQQINHRLAELRSRDRRLHFFPDRLTRSPLIGDDADNVWVPEYSPDPRFDQRYRVFSLHGQWIGWVEVPPRTQILDIRQGRTLVLHLDPFGVAAVALYRLSHGGATSQETRR